ncbi:MAG: hypothetical protein U5L06_09515 [Rhodovibrio sp.]|nr:hypothetical protein [Rhodovibrio sp.]
MQVLESPDVVVAVGLAGLSFALVEARADGTFCTRHGSLRCPRRLALISLLAKAAAVEYVVRRVPDDAVGGLAPITFSIPLQVSPLLSPFLPFTLRRG